MKKDASKGRFGQHANQMTKGQRRRGQAIAEGVAMLVVFVIVAVGVLLLIFNTAVVGGYDYKARIAAEQTAKAISKMKFWLGMERDDFNAAKAETEGRDICNQALQALGMPETNDFHVTYPKYHYTNSNGAPVEVEMVRVEIKVSNLAIFGGLLGKSVSLSAAGIAMEEGFPPYAVAIATYSCPDTKDVKSIRFPIYCARKQQVGTEGFVDNRSDTGFNKSGYANLGHITGPFTSVFLPQSDVPYHGGGIYRTVNGRMATQIQLPW